MSNHLFDGLFGKVDPAKVLADVPNGRQWTYGDALEGSARLAHALQDMGVEPGDRVAVQVPKSFEAVMVYIACVRRGAVFLPLNTAYTAKEVAYFVEDSGAKLLVCDSQSGDAYAEMAQSLGAGPISRLIN